MKIKMVCCASCNQWFNYDSDSKTNYIVKRKGYAPRYYCGVCNTTNISKSKGVQSYEHK